MTLEGKHLEFRNLIFLYQCHAQRYNMNSTSGSVREWKKMFCIPLLTFYNLSTILYFLYPLDRFLQLREAINILNQAINIKVHCVQHSFSTADATEKYCKEGSMAIAFPWCSAPSVNQRYAGILYPFVNRRRTFFRRPISKTAKDKKKIQTISILTEPYDYDIINYFPVCSSDGFHLGWWKKWKAILKPPNVLWAFFLRVGLTQSTLVTKFKWTQWLMIFDPSVDFQLHIWVSYNFKGFKKHIILHFIF